MNDVPSVVEEKENVAAKPSSQVLIENDVFFLPVGK
jgi:hypothetical protein